MPYPLLYELVIEGLFLFISFFSEPTVIVPVESLEIAHLLSYTLLLFEKVPEFTIIVPLS